MSGVAAIADNELTEVELAEARRVTKDVLQLGCALLPTLSRQDVEDEMLAAAKPEWTRWCRGNQELEKAWPKVAAVVLSAAEVLFDDRMIAAATDVERRIG